VTITRAPTNGEAWVNVGPNTVSANPSSGTAGRCAGKQVIGKQIMYQSKPGFHGSDVVSLEILSDRGQKSSTTVTIEVR
jgi:hypothetical protein